MLVGNLPVFHVKPSSDHQQAISYTDGDGGYITTDHVPSLLQYCREHAVPSYEVKKGSGLCLTVVPFREAFHDAVELGHTYQKSKTPIGDGAPTRLVTEAGYMALALQRRLVGKSSQTLITVHGVTSASGTDSEETPRLLVEVVTTSGDGDLASNGLLVVKNGLSFAATLQTPQAPRSYARAELEAKQQGCNIWDGDETYRELVELDDLKPWRVKRTIHSLGQSVTRSKQYADYHSEVTIVNQQTHLNEANLFVSVSTIPGAGLGLFIRPPVSSGDRTIPRGTALCLYDHPMDVADTHPDSDYYLCREFSGRQWHYDAREVNGFNIGRYANQGGLLEGLTELCTRAATHLDWSEINKRVQACCNTKFSFLRNSLYLVTTRELKLRQGGEAMEVLIDYGIRDYWLPYLLKRIRCLPLDRLQLAAVWPLTSRHSQLSDRERAQLLGGVTLPQAVVDHCRDLQCPFNVGIRRRTNSTQV